MATRAVETRPDPRARRYDPAETRDRVIAAAMQLFAKAGYVGTGTADIARAAEVSEGSIFYHFGSKRGLLAEIGRIMGEGMVDAMQAGDELADIDPGTVVERCFAFCAQNDIWQAVTGKGKCDGTATRRPDHHFTPEVEPFFQAARTVIVGWVQAHMTASLAARGMTGMMNVPFGAALMHAAVGEAMEMAGSGDLSPPEIQTLIAETRRFVRSACGFSG